MTAFQLLAFDFDGVICDGLIEYFQTAWLAYCQLFEPGRGEPPAGLAEQFYPLRPVVETGWEMPVLIRALLSGVSAEQVVSDWPQLAEPYLRAAGLSKAQCAKVLDEVRDRAIETNLQNWLDLHRFYPGMLDLLNRLLAANLPVYIVSTKEGRFIQALLSQSGVNFPSDRILGKEIKQPKYQTLRQLQQSHQGAAMGFIEDRLPALEAVKAQPDLDAVALFLADWGYNLPRDRAAAIQDPRIHLVSLEQLVQKFEV